MSTGTALVASQSDSALSTLADYKRHSRPLPDLLPFPFQPDPESGQETGMGRGRSRAPRPSRFTPGEVTHSDYESELEGGIPVRWRANSEVGQILLTSP